MSNINTILRRIRKEQKDNIIFIDGKPYFKNEIKPKNTFAKGVQKRFSNGKKVSDKLRRLI